MDYITAYKERMERNHKTFLQVANNLKKEGCRVFVPNHRLINFIFVLKDGKNTLFGFEDVPYRWTTHYELDPREKSGSSACSEERHGCENTFTTEDILKSMRTNPFPTDEMIKKHWFLKEI